MTLKTRQITIAIIAFVAIVGFSFWARMTHPENTWLCRDDGTWAKLGNPSTPMPTEGCGPVLSGDAFSHEGNLVTEDGKGDGRFAFLYEQLGAPALRVTLAFTAASRCVTGEKEENCIPSAFTVGQRVRVEGKIVDDVVTVLRLTSLQE